MAILSIVACKTERCPQKEPTLTFYNYIYKPSDASDPRSTDTLKLLLEFEDCQGDVGIKGGTEKNLHTKLYERINGEWVKFLPANIEDSNLLFTQIPASNKLKDGQKVEGLIEQPFGSLRQNSDTIRFVTQLFDREGNKSVKLTTPEFVFPN